MHAAFVNSAGGLWLYNIMNTVRVLEISFATMPDSYEAQVYVQGSVLDTGGYSYTTLY
jgi:hypothetical protein